MVVKPVSELAEVTIRSMASNGSGVGKLPDGRVVFVPRTAPGDLVRVRVSAVKRRWANGHVDEVLQPAEGRTDPPCPLYERCGGCSLQHLPYTEQLKWKGRFVVDALSRIGRLEVDEVAVTASPKPLRYRNKITFTLKRLSGGRVVAGFHHLRRSNYVVDVKDECILPEPELSSAWTSLRENWGANAARLPAGGRLRLTLRNSKSGVYLFVQGGRSPWNAENLVNRVPSVSTVWHHPSDSEEIELVHGRPHEDVWGGNRVMLIGDAFLQVNRGAAQLLEEYVKVRAGFPDTAIDAYCGIGQYGRTLANLGTRVVGIDVSAAALASPFVRDDENYQTVQGTVEEHISDYLPTDLLVLNPPRSGLEHSVPVQILAAPPKRVIYISCDAATLARDLYRLAPVYSLVEHRAFDFFPQTAHIETVMILKRSGN
ncbi:MAG TPA: class I SAM-dependent RNA methyltransferase [Gemmatimonadetes bacterium]|nr:class I SAM-dependent RNA methyltransferase [Gemmatimonadota bacterium]